MVHSTSHENSIDSSDTLCDVANAPRVLHAKIPFRLWDILMEIAWTIKAGLTQFSSTYREMGSMYLHDGALDKHLSLEQLVLRGNGLYGMWNVFRPLSVHENLRLLDLTDNEAHLGIQPSALKTFRNAQIKGYDLQQVVDQLGYKCSDESTDDFEIPFWIAISILLLLFTFWFATAVMGMESETKV